MKENMPSPCGVIVKNNDPDRFLVSMFFPADIRADLWALFAFNHEIAKTREVVSESTLGLIRLQWWRDAISGIYDGKILSHEVVEPLAAAIARHGLPREYFDTLIYAREFDLEDVLPGNLEGLMNYADFTTTPLLKLAVRIAGGDELLEPVQPIATNYALMGIIRSVHFHAAQGRCYLPEDLMQHYDLKRYGIGNPAYRDKLCNIIKEVEQGYIKGVKPDSKFLRITEHLSSMCLQQLESCEYDTMSQKYQIPPHFKVLRLVLRNFFM